MQNVRPGESIENGVSLSDIDFDDYEMRIPAEWFCRYALSGGGGGGGGGGEGEGGGEGCVITINSSTLFKILNSRDKQQTLTIVYDAESRDTLKIVFQLRPAGEEGGAGAGADSSNIFDKEFCIPLVEMIADVMTIPEEENYDGEIALPSSTFERNVDTMKKMFYDTMEIQCSHREVSFYCNNVESGKMRVYIQKRDEADEQEGDNEDEDDEDQLRLSFSLNYLCNISLYHKIAKEIVLNLSSGYPMKAVYDLGQGVSIIFYLAPKIDDEL